jgi:putative hydrolase of HD superfamily
MEKILNFFIEIGKLKKKKRRGWVLRKVKNPESIASHTFRMAIMAWLLGSRQKKLKAERILKMSLIHDLCETYAGDTTPYDRILPKNRQEWKKILGKWPRFSQKEKERNFLEKYKRENQALEKLIFQLPSSLKKEIQELWMDYEKGLSPEGRFVRQLDRAENLLQALEYWKKDGRFAIGPWWIQIEELVDNPVLLEFLQALESRFHQKKQLRKNKRE